MDRVTKYKILQLLNKSEYVTSKNISNELFLSQKTTLKIT